jgi:predicted CopG family antitoxin
MARDMYRKLPYQGAEPRSISEVVNNLVEGKSNNTGDITLNASSATTTTISDERIGYNSIILLMPTTANAVASLTNVYVSARTKGSATLTHSANTNTDKTYGYIIVG